MLGRVNGKSFYEKAGTHNTDYTNGSEFPVAEQFETSPLLCIQCWLGLGLMSHMQHAYVKQFAISALYNKLSWVFYFIWWELTEGNAKRNVLALPFTSLCPEQGPDTMSIILGDRPLFL